MPSPPHSSVPPKFWCVGFHNPENGAILVNGAVYGFDSHTTCDTKGVKPTQNRRKIWGLC